MKSKVLLIFFLPVIMNVSFSQNMITDGKSSRVIFPFSIEINPMERLLLVNFEKDPDSIYVGLEPQVFNDEVNGAGHLVIGWRKDKKIDVYHEKSLNLDSSKYNIAGAGLNQMIAIDMEKAYYEVNNFGVQAHYKFTDMSGREVEIVISEKNQRERKPFGLLAPMGDAATNPSSLPLVILQDFYFVRKNHTDIKVEINNKSHKLYDLPLRMDGQKMTFVRYSPKPLIATMNPAHYGELETFELETGKGTFEKGDHIYEIDWSNQSPSIRSYSVKNEIHLLTMSFKPSFPCLNTFPANTTYKGSFRISGHESVGTISGEYHIQSDNESVSVRVVPSKGWKPKATKFSTRFLFTVARVFKKWPTTYQWDAELHEDPEGVWYMRSKWIRTGKILKD
jgi:hypothetical protein